MREDAIIMMYTLHLFPIIKGIFSRLLHLREKLKEGGVLALVFIQMQRMLEARDSGKCILTRFVTLFFTLLLLILPFSLFHLFLCNVQQ